METILTVAEVANELRSLEGRYALTARGIRYYARAGMVVSTGRMRPGSRARATRLYSVIDIALLRLICRLQRQKVHERAIWGLFVYRGGELRHMLEQGSGIIAVDAPAALAIRAEESTAPKPIRVEVSSLVDRLAERLVAYRSRHPRVWTGLAWVDAGEVARQIADARGA